jgi:glyceraldehyde 3-phosphate dehydrogenase
VSNASCTTNCLAPIAKILDDAFGLEEGFMTTVHAYTNDQSLADMPHRDLRQARAAAENIIPTTTGAARTVGKVLPHLEGRLDGMAMRVPVPDGSIVDFAARVRARPTGPEVNAAVRAAAAGPMRGIVEYSEVPLVSSDIVGNPCSSIVDALSTAAAGDGFVKVVSWYDNVWGYSNRVVDLIDRLIAVG